MIGLFDAQLAWTHQAPRVRREYNSTLMIGPSALNPASLHIRDQPMVLREGRASP